MTTDTRAPLRDIQSALARLGHSPGPIDGLWGQRTAHALKSLLAAGGRAFPVAEASPLPWITEARSALGRHEARDRFWLMHWLKRDGRSLADPARNAWCGDFVETCIRIALPDEPLLGVLGSNPYWARNWLMFGQEIKPTPGAVLVFSRGTGGHVGFAMGQDDTHFHVLGGNQSDAVTIARIAKSRCIAIRWPSTASAPIGGRVIRALSSTLSVNEA